MEARRHDLVRAEPAAWAELLAARLDLADPAWLAGWAERGWPLMIRRPASSDPVTRMALGLPLPPLAGKRRIALYLPLEALGAPERPPLLSAIQANAPTAWRTTIARLLALDPAVRTYGSLAWQALTGLEYLGPDSDLDLLWSAPPAAEAEALLAEVAAIEAEAPMRLDGEFTRPDGAAVHWRELAAREREVLIKRLDGVALASRRSFLEACG